MRLNFTPETIAEVEDQLIKRGIAKSFLDFMEDDSNYTSMRSILLIISAGVDENTTANDYLVEWCNENNKTWLEIWTHILDCLGEAHFFDLDRAKARKGQQVKADREAHLGKSGSKVKKQL